MKTLFLLLPLLLLYSCKKESLSPNDQLPDPYNTEKRHVFGCKLNGEVWLPGRNLFAISYYYLESDGSFNISGAINNNGIYESIALTSVVKDTGYYKNLQPQVFVDLTGSENPDWNEPCAEYLRDSTKENYIHIDELDFDNGVIIGSFEDYGISQCGDTVLITDGRFKVTYK